VDRIKKLSLEILKNYKNDFGTNFLDNKKTLEKISIIRSKGLKNEIAGYITKYFNHELLDKKKKDERIDKQAKLDVALSEKLDTVEPTIESVTETSSPNNEEKPQTISE